MQFKFWKFEIFLWKKRRFWLRWDSRPSLSISIVSIVDYVSDYRKRLTSEMIHIQSNTFSINQKRRYIYFEKNLFPIAW